MQKMMTVLMTLAMAFAISTPAFPEELVTISWDTTRPLAGRVIEDSQGKGAVLALENDTGVPVTATFARVENPGVTASNFNRRPASASAAFAFPASTSRAIALLSAA